MPADDITPTDSPAIIDPTYLDEEAVKPVSNNLLVGLPSNIKETSNV